MVQDLLGARSERHESSKGQNILPLELGFCFYEAVRVSIFKSQAIFYTIYENNLVLCLHWEFKGSFSNSEAHSGSTIFKSLYRFIWCREVWIEISKARSLIFLHLNCQPIYRLIPNRRSDKVKHRGNSCPFLWRIASPYRKNGQSLSGTVFHTHGSSRLRIWMKSCRFEKSAELKIVGAQRWLAWLALLHLLSRYNPNTSHKDCIFLLPRYPSALSRCNLRLLSS